MIFDETKPETITKLLRAVASGEDAKKHRHDVIFNEAADMIESLLAVIEDQDGTIAYLKGATA